MKMHKDKKEPLAIVLEDPTWTCPSDYIVSQYEISYDYVKFVNDWEKTCRKLIKRIARKSQNGIDCYNQSYCDSIIKQAMEIEVARMLKKHKEFQTLINSKIFEGERNKVSIENRLEGIKSELEWIQSEEEYLKKA